MAWDSEKYREKREKVLGVRKRGIPFSGLTAVTAGIILLGAASLSLPGAVAYMKTRHLDDAIFKLAGNQAWPGGIVATLAGMDGVFSTVLDTHNTRLVVTFDRRRTRPSMFTPLFSKHDLKFALLNRVGHRQRLTTLEQEKEADQ